MAAPITPLEKKKQGNQAGNHRNGWRLRVATNRIDAAVRIDVQRVVVLARVAEEAVVRVEHLLRQQVEPLARHAAVVEALLAAELDHQPLAQVFGPQLHDAPVRFLPTRKPTIQST